jgi:hypothetical protein
VSIGNLYRYDEADLLRRCARQNAELREILTLVAQDLERLACEHPEWASGFLARAQRIRARMHWAGGSG